MRVTCTVIRRVGISEYEVVWQHSPPEFTSTVLFEAWFEPILLCVQYEMFVRIVPVRQPPQASARSTAAAPTTKPRARFIELIDIRPAPWSAALHRHLWFPGSYVDGETFEQYIERTRAGAPRDSSSSSFSAAPAVSFEKLRWIRWTTYNTLVHMFGELIASIEVNRYIEQQRLLEMADVREWLRTTEAQRRCPFRIHPEVVRVMFEHIDRELVDEVAVIEEMKYAMCKHQSPFVTSTQFMRVLNFCSDVPGAVKRLIERNVVRKINTSADDYQLWFAGDEVESPPPTCLVEEGEPVWELVRAGVRWRRAQCVPQQQQQRPPLWNVYRALDKVAALQKKDKRAFMHLKIFGDPSSVPRTVRALVESTEWCQKVMFVYAYDRALHRPTPLGNFGTKNWRLMRSRVAPYEYVFVQETVTVGNRTYRVHDLTKDGGGAPAVYVYANAMTLMGKYSCVEAISFDCFPKSIAAKCDLVVLLTKRSSPAQAAWYLHTALQATAVNVLVVGEWGVC